MIRIYKYELDEMMPVNVIQARFLKPLRVDYQNGRPFLWAVVSDSMPLVSIDVLRVGTGQEVGSDVPMTHYLNTTVAQSEPYVWHWFWR